MFRLLAEFVGNQRVATFRVMAASEYSIYDTLRRDQITGYEQQIQRVESRRFDTEAEAETYRLALKSR